GDGLLDGYEVANGLDPLDPYADADGDGVSDADEWLICGTSPNNPDDVLKVLSLVVDELGNVAVEWEGRDGVDYKVQYSTDLSQWFDIVDGYKTGSGTLSYTGNPGVPETSFFRIVAW
ncbi:MAG: hypothetical protein KAH23_04385, partial [Kiritimatiellae bacterium]|nr:hypothetical protein [Kiritimatiellia bacterium]